MKKPFLEYKSGKTKSELAALWDDFKDYNLLAYAAWIDIHRFCNRNYVDGHSEFSEKYECLQSSIQIFLRYTAFPASNDFTLPEAVAHGQMLADVFFDMLIYFSENMDNADYLGGGNI